MQSSAFAVAISFRRTGRGTLATTTRTPGRSSDHRPVATASAAFRARSEQPSTGGRGMGTRTLVGTILGLALGGMVSLGVATPPAHADGVDDLVGRFYSDVLDRSPEVSGATSWSNFLHANCNASGFETLARNFFASDEFLLTKSLTIDQLVSKFYRALLNRQPEAGGAAAWADVIRQARVRIALSGFVPSPEFRSLLPDRTN